MKKTLLTTLLFAVALSPSLATGHCQVPCGNYDDDARVTALSEDATTIGKAVGEIQKLSGKTDDLSTNQRTRWVMTKEEHASRIITVVSEYFLTQKIKAADAGDAKAWAAYTNKLAACHGVMRAAMKAKQTVDPAAVESLKAAIAALKTALQ